ncbi:MAG: AAA family ATPase [Bacillales bacterium]|jgi:AAA+ ATPase superfamily predicted ATPase|nr:AAA family ATPase [Bacillales bacterium]
MIENIIGRNYEKQVLKSAYESTKSEFIILYGRRRVGKSFLINEFFNNSFFFDFSGLSNKNKDETFKQFQVKLKTNLEINNWFDGFNILRDKIALTDETTKKVIFLDEFPWMDITGGELISSLEFFLNDFVFKRHDILLIVSGSVTSWIIKKILNAYNGLYKRVTKQIKLQPFKLNEVKEFLTINKGMLLSNYNIAEIYMVFGGIPYYLDYFSKELTISQNIDMIFFRENSPLKSEKKQLFESMFLTNSLHYEVINCLSNSWNGLTRNQITDKLKLPNNGRISSIIDDLIEAGFIKNYPNYPNKKKEEVYAIIDNFLLFYNFFIENNKENDSHFWENNYLSSKLSAWRGLSFEKVVLNHIDEVKNALGILRVSTNIYTLANQKTQIDLIIDRKDQIVNLCEIKFSINEFVIGKDYDLSLRNKIVELTDKLKTNKNIQVTFITTYGVRKNEYSSLISNDITIDKLFCEIPL